MAKLGLKRIDWALYDDGVEPDVVLLLLGTEPNMESLLLINCCYDASPDLKIASINGFDLLKRCSPEIDPRGLSELESNSYSTTDKPIFLLYVGFEGLIRDISFTRVNRNVLIYGYREEGDMSTPFDSWVLNELDRSVLAKDVF